MSPTSEPMTSGEVARAIERIERSIASLADKMVNTTTLELTLRTINQSLKAIDDRHTELAKDFEAERQARQDSEKIRVEDKKSDRRILWGAAAVAVLSVIIPLALKGVGIS